MQNCEDMFVLSKWNQSKTYSFEIKRDFGTDYGICCWYTPQLNFTEIDRYFNATAVTTGFNLVKFCTDTREKTTYMNRTGASGSWMFQRWVFIFSGHKHVWCTLSVWAVDDKWLSGYKLDFVFSSADVLFLKPFPAGFFRGGLQKLFKRFVFLYVSFQFRLSLLPRKAEKKLGWQNLNLNF